MVQNNAGQPADVIAVKNGRAVIIDCKLCLSDKFPLDRVEFNQQCAMDLWNHRGNHEAYFALKFKDNSIYMIHYSFIQNDLEKGIKSYSKKEVINRFISLDEWMVMR